jgi:hypothetical protein
MLGEEKRTKGGRYDFSLGKAYTSVSSNNQQSFFPSSDKQFLNKFQIVFVGKFDQMTPHLK